MQAAVLSAIGKPVEVVDLALEGPRAGEKIPIRAGGLFLERRLVGCSYGHADPRRDIPRLLAHARSGALNLDALVSHELPLARVGEALAALAAGRGVRHVIVNDRG